MNKILSGSAVNYGSILPPLSKTTDGAMFYLVDTYTDPAGSPSNSTTGAIIRGAGLYTYVFAKDANVTALGNQAGYMWVTVANMENFVKKLGDEMTGSLLMTGQVWSGILQIKNKTPAIRLSNTANIADHQELRIVYDTISATKAGIFSIQRRANENPDVAAENLKWLGDFLKIDTLGNISSFGNTVWHSGNDGAGTALDAGKLGGQLPAYYLDSSNQTGTLPVTKGGTGSTSVNVGGVLFGTSSAVASTAAGTAGQVLVSDGLNAPSWKNASTIASGTATALATARQIELTSGVTGKISFDGSKDVQIVTTVASVPWSSIADIADYGKTIQKKGSVPYTNIELSARPSYFYTYSILGANGTAVADMKPSHFPIQSITGFDAYHSDNQAVSAVSGNKMFRVGLTVRGEEAGGARSMQLAANWDYAEDTPFGGMFYRVNDDTHTVSEWGQWSQLVDAQYLKHYNQEIASSAPITASVVKAWDQYPSHGYVQMVSAGEVTNDPARYAGWIEYNARYPDNTESRLGWIGCGKYDYDNSKKTSHDSGQIVYTAKQHRFFGRIDTFGATTASSVAARSEPQLTGTVGGVIKEWDQYGSVQLDTAGTNSRTGTISFFAGYDSPEVGRRRAGYIGNAGYERTATNVRVGAIAAAPADNLGNLDYVAGHHHMFGNLYIHPDLSSTEATWSQVKMQVTAATGDISSVGRLFVGNPTTNSAGAQVRLSGVVAQVTGDAKVIGNLEVSGTITGAVSMTGIRVDAVNMNNNSVTTAALTDDSVTRAKVADEAVGPAQMGVNDLGNLCWNGKGVSVDGWQPSIATGVRVQPFTAWPSPTATNPYMVPSKGALVFASTNSYFGPIFNVIPGNKYFCEMDTYTMSVPSQAVFWLGLECYDEAGAVLPAGHIQGAVRTLGTSGHARVSGFATIPAAASQARVMVQVWDDTNPTNTLQTAAGKVHYATNMSVRHATYAQNSITASALGTNGNGTNIFSDYDLIESYWTNPVSEVDTTRNPLFTEPRVIRFKARTNYPLATSTFIGSVEQPAAAASRVYPGDELVFSYSTISNPETIGSVTGILRWYDADKVMLDSTRRNSPYSTVTLPVTTLTQKNLTVVVPNDARYMTVYFQRTSSANGVLSAGEVHVGKIQVIKKFDASLISDVIQTSGNLLTNTETSNKEPYLGRGWSFGEGGLNGATDDINAIGVNGSYFTATDSTFAQWYPPYAEPFVIHQTGQSTAPNAYMDYTSASFPVIAGEYYEVSSYAQTHRTGAAIYLQFVNASGTALTTLSESFSTETTASSGNARQLSLWRRIGKIGIAPPTAAAARVILRKWNTDPGQSDSYAWFLFPYAGRANSSQTILSAYSAGNPFNPTGGLISASNKITTANVASIISAGAIGNNELANDISLSTLSVTGTATVGSLTTSGGVTASQMVLTGSSFDALTLQHGGISVVQSGITAFGPIVSYGDITAFSSSDIRIKENIEEIPDALLKISKIRGVTFNRTDKDDKPREVGVIAQEIQEVLPEIVRTQSSGMLGLQYDKIVALLIQGIKEQQAQIEVLKADIEELKKTR